eukprot:12037263-Alexandrium_andersonii.AAC.1
MLPCSVQRRAGTASATGSARVATGGSSLPRRRPPAGASGWQSSVSSPSPSGRASWRMPTRLV